MDLNRGFRPNVQTNAQPGETVTPHQPHAGGKKPGKIGKFKSGGVINVVYIALLFSVTIVLIGLLLSLVLFKNSSREEKFVDTGKYQAVFLGNGQVYFGKINDLNKDFLSISDIYYLRVNQQVQPGQQASQNDVSLVKLGCELHGPQDNMVVNRDQVTFWENLKDDGQVAKAVSEYKKANPNGQNCEQQAQQQQNNTPAPAENENSNNNSNSNSSNGANNNSNSSNSNNNSNNSSNNP